MARLQQVAASESAMRLLALRLIVRSGPVGLPQREPFGLALLDQELLAEAWSEGWRRSFPVIAFLMATALFALLARMWCSGLDIGWPRHTVRFVRSAAEPLWWERCFARPA